MDTKKPRRSIGRTAAAAAVIVGLAAGGYGIGAAASGPDSGSSSSTAAATRSAAATTTQPQQGVQPPQGGHGGPAGGNPWGHQREDETPLTGDTAAKVTAAAKAKVGGGTVVRVETDADGNAAYEAHMVKADGTPVTVYVDRDFTVVSVETDDHRGHQRSDETPLTGDTAAKVTAAAKAKVGDATVVRVETDADGNAAYEAHMVKADGTQVTVYVDKDFTVVGVETR